MTQVNLKADERIDQLYQHGIQIIQSKSVFSFSLDAVLLAAFAKLPAKAASRTVDLCAGNGAVALFAAHQTSGKITEVEIQPRLADMARRSIQLNQLENRLSVLNIDLKDTFAHIAKDSVDVVTCNPPYFADLPNSKKNPNPHLAIARHEISANLRQIIQVASGLLKMNGKAYFVHRPDRLPEILDTLVSERLMPKRIRFVHPKANREANMVLIEAIKDGHPNGVRILPPVVVYDEAGHYQTEVAKLLYG